MALNGVGEPQPTLLQQATQAATIELFTQWQTYRNGVHMDWDTFRSIDFRALAIAVLTGAGFEVKAVNAAHDFPKPFTEPTQPSPLAQTQRDVGVTKVTEEWGAPVQQSSRAITEHERQVNNR